MDDYTAITISNIPKGRDGMELTVAIKNPPVVFGGQFAMLKTNRPELILRRPFGIAKADGNEFAFLYQLKGNGTKALATLKQGDELQITMPLGNHFDIGKAKRAAVVAGGYGVAPLLLTARQLTATKDIFLGFQSKSAIMYEREFAECGNLTVCTDDGSYGYKGYPSSALEERIKNCPPDIILCCGPHPMMRSIKQVGERYGIPTVVSLETRMGCGIGACLVCTCKVGGENKRVCACGPVFDAREVEL